MAQTVKNLTAMWETWVRSLGWEDPLEKEMATQPSILAWTATVHAVTKSRTTQLSYQHYTLFDKKYCFWFWFFSDKINKTGFTLSSSATIERQISLTYSRFFILLGILR